MNEANRTTETLSVEVAGWLLWLDEPDGGNAHGLIIRQTIQHFGH